MVKIAENAGFGLDKIDSNWQAYNHTEPIYDIEFDSVMVSLKTAAAKTEPTQVSQADMDIIAALGTITEVLEKGSEVTLAYLRKNYGVFTGYLRGKYGVNTDYLRDKFNERFVWELLLVDLFPGITQQQLGDILDTSLSSVEKDMRKLRKENIIDREGSDKTGKWIIQKKQ
jgi:predicted HTH transcriptional regulator